MRSRSSKSETRQGMEIDHKLNSKLKEEPRLSGAYIRSLVKQLTSSRTKDPMNSKDPETSAVVAEGSYPFTWSTPSPFAAPPVAENLNFTLPNQPLGLNLNLHDFNNLDTSLYHNPSLCSSSSSPSQSSSSSPTLSLATDQEVPNSVVTTPALADHVIESSSGTAGGSSGSGDLHAAMDDEEMAEIRSIGEQHQMEWNDTMNLVTSAWWFKFLKTMEIEGPAEVKAEGADFEGCHPFDEVMEFPSWLNANENCLQQHFNDDCTKDYLQYPALPCMDIGEIECMDGDWLS
nr:hypothetical protein CFP56_43627 [Quercus suber]